MVTSVRDCVAEIRQVSEQGSAKNTTRMIVPWGRGRVCSAVEARWEVS